MGRPTWLYFDMVYRGTAPDEKFSNLKSFLDAFLGGETVCIFNHGTTGSGKTYTMFGTNNSDVGILQRSAAYILNKTNIYVSATEYNSKNMIDLGDPDHTVINEKTAPKTLLVSSMDEINVFIAKVCKARCQKGYESKRNIIAFAFDYKVPYR